MKKGRIQSALHLLSFLPILLEEVDEREDAAERCPDECGEPSSTDRGS